MRCGMRAGRAAALAQGGERGPAGLISQQSVAERLSSRSGGECCEWAVRRRVRRSEGVRRVVVRVGHVYLFDFSIIGSLSICFIFLS